MIEQLSIRNFQSLQDVTVKLDRFTVIVGPSSSGKSAFTRACKTLTSNARGDSFITHGEQQTTITAKTDKGTVSLSRGKKNEYVVIPHEGEQRTYTKLAASVPEEVSEFIGIPAKDPLNYANQFDMPYLLSASAAEVARTLGELTNVSVIYEAAREANKRKQASAGVLKTRASDFQLLTSDLDKYRGLKAKDETLSRAEGALAEAKIIQTRILTLRSQLRALGEVPPEVVTRDLPDLTAIKNLQQSVARLRALIETAKTQQATIIQATTAGEKSKSATKEAQAAYFEALRTAGVCPTCGQGTGHLHG